MIDETFLFQLGLTVTAAAVFATAGGFLRVPPIVAYLVAGLVLGPALGWLEVGDSLELMSEAGIALLLFLVGLELSLEKIRRVGKVAVVAGLGQVLFTAAVGYALCWAMGFKAIEALFLAVALTFSSTVVVVKLLDEKGHLDRLYGRIAVGIFLVQDLVVIVVLTLLAGLMRGEGVSVTDLLYAFGGMAALLGAALAAARWVLPKPFAWAARVPSMMFVWALSWCFLLVFAAHAMGLSLEVGALLAGMALAQLPYNQDLRRRVHPLMSLFIAVFFVTLGAGSMDFGEIRQVWLTGLGLSLFVLIGNPLIFIFIIARMGYGEKTAFSSSVTVAQISEFSFIFAASGVAAGMIGQEILSLVALVGVVTIAVSSYMILHSDRLYDWCRRRRLLRVFRASSVEDYEDRDSKRMSGHVVVVGMNALGRLLVERLHKSGEAVLAIDRDPAKLAGLPCRTIIGDVDYRAVMAEADLADSKLAVSALQIEVSSLLFAYHCRELGVRCVAHAFEPSLMAELLELGVDYMLAPKIEGALRQRELLAEREGLRP